MAVALGPLWATGQQSVPPGDRYLCYKAGTVRGQPNFIPSRKTLEDQFGTRLVTVKKPDEMCNPAQENTEPSGVRSDVHQVDYRLNVAKGQAKFVKSAHTAIDQFGQHPLTVVKPVALLVPSAMALGPGGAGLVNSAGIDHFACYRVGTLKKTPKFGMIPNVTVADHFGAAVYDLKKITKLCAPTNKSNEDPTAPHHLGYLVCYEAKLAKQAPQVTFHSQTVSVNNTNFGPTVLVAHAVTELCVPAFKDTVPTTTTSSSTSTSTSSTTSTSATSTSTSSGTTTTTLGIEVLDLGHATPIASLTHSGTRVLSTDSTGHWVLWETTGRTKVLDGSAYAALAGDTIIVQHGGLVEVRNASDGSLRSTITDVSGAVRLAIDGSYLWTATAEGLSVWAAASGDLLVVRGGNYGAASIFGASGELRIARGPAGADRVELVSISDGSDTLTPPFSGSFHSWFVDGQRFISNLSTRVWIYSKDGVQEATGVLPTIENLTGQAGYVWTYRERTPGYPVDIYAMRSLGAVPVATFSPGVDGLAIPAGRLLGLIPFGQGSINIVDLDLTEVTQTPISVPVAYLTAFAGDFQGNWSVGNVHGVVFDSANIALPGGPRSLSYGAAFSVAGSGTGMGAIATASGRIVLFDLSSGPAKLSTEIPFASAHVEMSADAMILAASGNTVDSQYWADRSLKVFSLPTAAEVVTWPYSWSTYPSLFFDFVLSRGGTRLGQVFGTFNAPFWQYRRLVTDLTGSVTVLVDEGPGTLPVILISPNSHLVALPELMGGEITRIYDDGVFVTAVAGSAVGWLADDRLLVGGEVTADGVTPGMIYDSSGNFVSQSPLPAIANLQLISGVRLYSRDTNAIYDIGSGEVVWSGPSTAAGAVAGSYVVFPHGATVVAARY